MVRAVMAALGEEPDEAEAAQARDRFRDLGDRAERLLAGLRGLATGHELAMRHRRMLSEPGVCDDGASDERGEHDGERSPHDSLLARCSVTPVCGAPVDAGYDLGHARGD